VLTIAVPKDSLLVRVALDKDDATDKLGAQYSMQLQ